MELLVQAVLGRIQEEMERLYWNANHKELESPFLNTGNSYKDDVFEVNAYYWGDDENIMTRPNFKYGDFEGERDGRFFNDMTAEKFNMIMKNVSGFECVEEWESDDVRRGKEVHWFNAIYRKTL